MTLHVTIPDELDSPLRHRAAELGVSVEKLAAAYISKAVGEPSKPKTGEELVEEWQRQGLIGYRSDITDSESHARSLRDAAQQRDG